MLKVLVKSGKVTELCRATKHSCMFATLLFGWIGDESGTNDDDLLLPLGVAELSLWIRS